AGTAIGRSRARRLSRPRHGRPAYTFRILGVSAMDAKSSLSTADFIRKENRFGARNYAPVPVVVDRASDCLVWDVEGREYIDMMSAYSAVSHGHLHPRVVAALQGQLQKVAVT